MTHRYRAYGITIESEIALPELTPSPGLAADVRIGIGPVERHSPTGGRLGLAWWGSESQVHFYCQGIGAFAIRGGTAIVIDPLASTDHPLLHYYLINSVLAILAQQRGRLVLHGSVIARGGRACALIGHSGQGKSTTVAALYRLGCRVVSDSVMVVDLGPDRPLIYASSDWVKLLPDAVSHFVEGSGTGPPLAECGDKISARLPLGFAPDAVPLHCIYVLQDGPQHAIRPFDRQGAFASLVRHSCLSYDMLRMTGQAQAHLRQCADLADRVGVSRLERARGFVGLPALARLIEEDAFDVLPQLEQERTDANELGEQVPNWQTRVADPAAIGARPA